MARPSKTGLDYFPFDVDFFQDIKVRKLIKYQGCRAIPVYTFLLCRVYQGGYYLKWDEDLPFVISEATGYDEEYVNQVINSCTDIGLFSADLFRQNQILTSKGIQERYKTVTALTKRKEVISEYSLINSEEIPVNSEETPVNSGKSAQRKENKKKENKREDNDESLSGSPPAFVQRELNDLKNKSDPPEFRAAPLTLDEIEGRLRDNRFLLETACMSKKVTPAEFLEALKEFFADKRATRHSWKSEQDATQHFLNWLPKWKQRQAEAPKGGKLTQAIKSAVTAANEGEYFTFNDVNTR
ncbi:DUF4373 domain-containing protein [Dyadobacter fermentans]|uniref:DUF4373 domain-containing protein n=1 Tax=Dyadobacter fermentans TaxID=94254 RepID=UPI001CBCA038|nr:DUF4373 domain-containing protein [Dyadobacter fermentans]MBZ1362165.1 DUF4373 domain-containing protein [Dyadobacter fermentans]